MSLLIDTLPKGYEFGGRVYEMRTDFRDWIRFELLLTNEDIPIDDKTQSLMEMIFPVIPPDEKLLNFILWFYQCGRKPPEASGKKSGAKKQAAVYSFEYDDCYIYSAFKEIYGIDLTEISYLHWWKFRGMFISLHDCKFTEIMGYRTEKITSKTSAARKEFLTEVKKIYALPRSQTEQQKIDELKKLKEKYYGHRKGLDNEKK